MIYKRSSPLPNHIRVIFELPGDIWADQVALTCDCNGWDRTRTPLHQERDNVWRATVDLPLGSQCQFRYWVDGHWLSDDHADGFAKNAYGSDNSIVIATMPTEKTMPAEKTPVGRSFVGG